jgi:hypothetical protein
MQTAHMNIALVAWLTEKSGSHAADRKVLAAGVIRMQEVPEHRRLLLEAAIF